MSESPGSIALVTPRYAPAIGGVERHVEAVARELVGRGVSVEVITTDPTDRLPAYKERDGVLVHRFPTIASDSTYFISPALGNWLLRNASRFSLLHAHSYHTPLALQAAVAGCRHGVPLVLTPHYHGVGHSQLRSFLHRPYRLAGAWMLKRAEQVLCVSEVERRLLRRHFGLHRRTVVVPNGVDVDEICGTPPKSVPSEQAVILTVGRLEHYKQTDRLVAAIPLLDPDAELVVVGDGPARTRIRQLAARLGVESRLRLMGPLARQDLLAWYRRADVFVSLSRHEAFGLTVLEAAVAGARIVASDIPAHREVAGYISPASMTFVATGCNSSTLADTINSLSRAHRPSGTTHHAPTWSTTAEGVLRCYQEVSRDRISESRAQAVA